MTKAKKKKMPDLLGGQALIEGVMMKGKDSYAMAVYNPDKKLIIKKVSLASKKNKFYEFPFIRGVYNMYVMMKIGINSLNYSAKIAMPEEKESNNVFSTIISVAIAITLFMVIPAFIFNWLNENKIIENLLTLNLAEGLVRFTIFISFLLLMSLDKDIRRVFAYHGAEHKTVYAYEAQEELTVENVKKHSRLHPRCGTAFIMLVLILSIIIYSFFGRTGFPERILYKLIFLPILVSITYETVRLIIKLPKWLVTFLLLPGLFLQLITTKNPDDEQIKAAIAAIKQVN